MVMALAMMTMMGGPSASAQEGGSVSIYSFACPAGFDGGDYDACRATPLSGVGFTLFEAGQHSGVGATSDADGAASLGLPIAEASTINIFTQPPAGYESVFIACSEEYGAVDGGITFASLAPDAFVTCEWYFVPTADEPPSLEADGSLSVYIFGCPEGFDGADFGECEGRPVEGVSLVTAAAGQDNGVGEATDPSGSAWFPLFAADLPGNINLHLTLPEGYATFTAACWGTAGTAADFAYTDSGITLLDVPDGAEVACALYLEQAASDDGDSSTGIKQLPNTGAGTMPTPVSTATAWLLLLGMGSGAAGLAMARAGRRVQ
jgi:hypothetical protein